MFLRLRPTRWLDKSLHRGEFGLCDPRRSQATTGASVRLTSVAQAHPYPPRQRAKREYERGPFSRLAQRASDGQPGAALKRQRHQRSRANQHER